MVYYGALSKGCERCRQRKCDQRKPGCLRCERLDTECPGYRDLNQVLFRDENRRVIRKAKSVSSRQERSVASSTTCFTLQTDNYNKAPSSLVHSNNISRPLSQSINELGASFFFAKYTYNSPPYSIDYHEWLTRSYLDDGASGAMRAGIQAVGMAGISNTSYAPDVTRRSKQKYGEAIAALKHALNDPVQVIDDSTLMAVLLLGVFEMINFETWDRYHHWTAHVKAATALLELRGTQQFTTERGAQLYIQSRAQILLACMQQEIPVPSGLVQATYNFETSGIRQQWRTRKYASPGSISEISFRTANLRAALRNGEITDPKAICDLALEIDADLENWRAVVPATWNYKTIHDPNAPVGTPFEGKSHVYPSLWIVEIWNNWRILRILINHIIVRNDVLSNRSDHPRARNALSVIRRLSSDIILSIPCFSGRPRMISLVQPLYVVCLEEHNHHNIRSFAVEQLRNIARSTGIRQAGLLADIVSKQLSNNLSCDELPTVTDQLTIPCPLVGGLL